MTNTVQKQQQELTTPLQKELSLVPYMQYFPLRNITKSGKKLKGPVLFKDKTGKYPDFILDTDNFFYCTVKDCNDFFPGPSPKGIKQHYSSLHNKHENPNQVLKLKRLERQSEKANKKVMEQDTKQSNLFDLDSK
ncbi:MAG: hypothetical protein L0H53_00515 [Candidatus Nitrosocosmicus sp.]|nr:hypothetical protein [Candidatus Nitrosocosmicus sp.]MDN5866019.1 hypothetical protein [Candidatus Nitrosocosmicus sp.]